MIIINKLLPFFILLYSKLFLTTTAPGFLNSTILAATELSFGFAKFSS